MAIWPTTSGRGGGLFVVLDCYTCKMSDLLRTRRPRTGGFMPCVDHRTVHRGINSWNKLTRVPTDVPKTHLPRRRLQGNTPRRHYRLYRHRHLRTGVGAEWVACPRKSERTHKLGAGGAGGGRGGRSERIRSLLVKLLPCLVGVCLILFPPNTVLVSAPMDSAEIIVHREVT